MAGVVVKQAYGLHFGLQSGYQGYGDAGDDRLGLGPHNFAIQEGSNQCEHRRANLQSIMFLVRIDCHYVTEVFFEQCQDSEQ